MKHDILTTTTRIDILPDGSHDKHRVEQTAHIYASSTNQSRQYIGGHDFQQLLQNIYDGTIISDTDGYILDTNKRSCQFLKCDPDDIIGTNIISILYGSDISLIYEIKNSLQDNRYILIQAACVRSDGSTFPAEISVNIIELNDTHYFCFFIRDITIRRKAEEKIRTGYTAIQNAATGIAVTDLDGTIQYANAAALHLWNIDTSDPEYIAGKDIRNLLCDHTTADNILNTIRDGHSWEGEITGIASDKSNITVRISAAPNRNPDNEIIGMVMSLLDITELVQANDRVQRTLADLRCSNCDLEQFAYAVSHDLQAPLRKISMFADIVKMNTSTELDPTVLDAINRMQNAAKRMSELITGLLQYSRVTTNHKNHENIGLNEIVTGVLNDLEAPLLESGGEVDVGELPEIAADPMQMRQLFQNLIGNALKFHKPDTPPVVTIRAGIVQENHNTTPVCNITVSDNGIGFDPQHTERIFGVFQRLHSQSEFPGTGIGLSICKKIVERHNGNIAVSAAKNEGATFTISLPLPHQEITCSD